MDGGGPKGGPCGAGAAVVEPLPGAAVVVPKAVPKRSHVSLVLVLVEELPGTQIVCCRSSSGSLGTCRGGLPAGGGGRLWNGGPQSMGCCAGALNSGCCGFEGLGSSPTGSCGGRGFCGCGGPDLICGPVMDAVYCGGGPGGAGFCGCGSGGPDLI